jgi:hypothetical protein
MSRSVVGLERGALDQSIFTETGPQLKAAQTEEMEEEADILS